MNKGKWYITDLEKNYIGHWLYKPIYEWRAYCYDSLIAQASSKRECVRLARERGYVVVRELEETNGY